MLKKLFVTIGCLFLSAAGFVLASDSDKISSFQPNVKPILDIRRVSGPIHCCPVKLKNA